MKQIDILRRCLARLRSFLVLAYALVFIFLVLCLDPGWPGALLGGALGWYIAGWRGALVGLFAGSVVWIILATGYHVAWMLRLTKRRQQRMSKLSNEELRQMVTKPTGPDAMSAILELDRRGIEARPSLDSLFPLLTSPDRNRR